MKLCALAGEHRRLTDDEIKDQAPFSRSQLYRWQQGEDLDRKEREQKAIPEKTVEQAASVVATYPHLGGRKGQAYMLYHQLGSIGEKKYDEIKGNARRLFMREVARRELFSAKEAFEHIRPKRPGEIWAEDFTDVVVDGRTFKVATLIDVYDEFYLGAAAGVRATAALVRQPIDQALKLMDGWVPRLYLLSDNGSQYISETHGRLLTSLEIVQRRIPACVPQYNGAIEGSMREFKSVFYNVWERRKRTGADKEKSLLEQVRSAVKETITLLNEAIPRPSLGGVTPADVHYGRKGAKQREINQYREEESRRDVPPWTRDYWKVLKSGLGLEAMSDDELLTKSAFFGRKPLRRIAKRNRECVG